MPSVAILIGSEVLSNLAQRWVAAGLMGPVLFLDNATAEIPMDAAAWQSVEGLKCSHEGAFRVRVQESLAAKEELRSITVVWVRDDTEDFVAGMASVGAFARRIIHQDTAPRLIDLIGPTRAEGVDTSLRAQGWEQLVVVPEDRPELQSPDAGWISRRQAVLLHAAAAALGRLGGRSGPLPAPSGPEPRALSVWSRHGLGGESLRREAVEFLDRRLPDLSAQDIKPRQYAVFAEQWEQVPLMVEWLRGRYEGQLRYTRLEPRKPVVNPFADASAADAAPTRGRRILPDDAPSPGPLEREQQWREATEKELKSIRKSDGAIPPRALWSDVVQLLSATIDGGELPNEFAPSEAHGHRLVVECAVAGPAPELVPQRYPADEEDIPELRYWPPMEIAAEALTDVIAELSDGDSPGVPFPALRGNPPRHHGALVDDLVEGDRRAQRAQRDRLAQVELDQTKKPRSAADTLWARLMADATRARLDADRWHKAATAPWPVQRRRVSASSLIAAVLALLSALFSAGWLLDGALMNDLIASVGLGPWNADIVGLSALGVAVVLAVLAFLLLPRGEDDGYWAWRMALRLQLSQRAAVAYRDARRLDNALRVYHYWWLVLRDIFPLRDEADEPVDDTELEVPRALQHGPVEVHLPYRDLVLSQAGVEPGWRSEAIGQLASLSHSKYGDESSGDALQAALGDVGYEEGTLYRLQRDLPGTWQELRARWIERAVRQAKIGLIGPASRVGGEHRPQLLSAFLDEVRTGAIPTLWHELENMELGAEIRFTASSQPDHSAQASIEPTMAGLAAEVLVVLRPLRASQAWEDAGQMGDPGVLLIEDEDEGSHPY